MYELWHKLLKLALDWPLLSVIESVVGDDRYDDHTSLQRQHIVLSSGSYPQAFVVGFQMDLAHAIFSSRQGGDRLLFSVLSSLVPKLFKHTSFSRL